jgi:hypothetical protein
MGSAEGRDRRDDIPKPGVGADQSRLDRRGVVEQRQNPWETPGKHGLASAGRAVEEDVMAARSRDLERPLRQGLAPYVGHVRQHLVFGGGRLGLHRRAIHTLGQEGNGVGQGLDRMHFGPWDEGNLSRMLSRHQTRDPESGTHHRSTQRAPAPPHLPIE